MKRYRPKGAACRAYSRTARAAPVPLRTRARARVVATVRRWLAAGKLDVRREEIRAGQ
jgi:hypothetical protein